MDNLTLYNKVREVPKEATKTIAAGRTKGFTDINPMWRIKTLTENFGMAGIGWYYDIKRMWLEKGANEEISAFVEIELFVKCGEQWSKPITGVGGSSFVAKESKGLYTSDECYKMALTDAISVSCKALGIGADVYYSRDRTKYDEINDESGGNGKDGKGRFKQEESEEYKCCDCGKPFEPCVYNGQELSAGSAFLSAKTMSGDGKARCKDCRKKIKEAVQRE